VSNKRVSYYSRCQTIISLIKTIVTWGPFSSSVLGLHCDNI